MAKTIEQIQEEVQQIKNETVAKQNTATRVGGALEDMVEKMEADSISVEGKLSNLGSKVGELSNKTENISTESATTEEDAIVITTDAGVQVGKIDNSGADFKNLKSNGKGVLTEHQDISQLATKTEVSAKASTTYVNTELAKKQGTLTAGENVTITPEGVISAQGGVGKLPIVEEVTTDEDDLIDIRNERDESVVKITPNGLMVSSITNMKGGSLIPFEVQEPFTNVQEVVLEDDLSTKKYVSLGEYGVKAVDLIIKTDKEEKSVKELFDKIEPVTDETPLSTIYTDGGELCIFETIAQIGDSLASGEMAYSDAYDESTTKYIDMYPNSWMSYIGRKTGRTVFNFSRGGASTSSFLAGTDSYADNKYSGNLAGKKIKQHFVENPVQCYFIALGHNDRNNAKKTYPNYETMDTNIIRDSIVGTSSDIPDVTDIENNTTDKYIVRYAKVINEIKKIQPYAKIFPICMIAKGNKENMWEKEGWNDAIRYMADIYSDIYIIDMGKYGTLPSWHYTQGHGNSMGYNALANEYASYASYIIKKNRDLFKYVSFIGSGKDSEAIKPSSRGSVGSEF